MSNGAALVDLGMAGCLTWVSKRCLANSFMTSSKPYHLQYGTITRLASMSSMRYDAAGILKNRNWAYSMAYLTQSEADVLIAMDKYRVDNKFWNYPPHGSKVLIPLKSADEQERFFLDINRRNRDELKVTYQNRARTSEILFRLCIRDTPHRNPDGEEIESPHIHIYREGYGDKWAVPIPSAHFDTDPTDTGRMFYDFMRRCNIVQPPNMRMVL